VNTVDLPWYRQPMLWLVIAIPAATVPAGLVTVAIAMHDADAVVADDYRVEALGVSRDAARDRAAADGDVHATLTRGTDGGFVVGLRTAATPLPDSMLLHIAHATLASADRDVALVRDGAQTYRSGPIPLPAGRWRFELTPPSRGWRLTAQVQAPFDQLALDPRRQP